MGTSCSFPCRIKTALANSEAIRAHRKEYRKRAGIAAGFLGVRPDWRERFRLTPVNRGRYNPRFVIFQWNEKE